MSNARYEIENSSDGQFYFVLKAGNGEIILKGERYTTKQNCENGIASVRKNGMQDKNYRKLQASDGSPYFNLCSADNGQVIGTSQMYSDQAARDHGIESVKANCGADVVDAG